MPRFVNRSRSAAALVCALGFALSACSRPAGPASSSTRSKFAGTPAVSATGGDRLAKAAALPRPGVVSWSCFEAGGCTPSRVTLRTVQLEPVITAAPTNLQRSVQGSTVSLGWQPPAGSQPTSYVIEAGTSPGASNIAVFDTGSASNGIVINNVPNGTYYVRVRGKDSAGVGPVSNEVTVTVGNAPPPPPPDGCAITGLQAAAIGSTVAARWRPSFGTCNFNGFLLGVGNVPGVANLATVTITNGFSFLAENVPSGTYYLVVRALVGSNIGPPSNAASVVVTGVAPPGTTVWSGLAANGDGFDALDEDCGPIKGDLLMTLVQTGSTVTGFATVVLRQTGSCQDLLGFSDTTLLTGTATGSLADGSGTFTGVSGSGNDASTLNATFGNGQITGTTISNDGTSTFRVRKR